MMPWFQYVFQFMIHSLIYNHFLRFNRHVSYRDSRLACFDRHVMYTGCVPSPGSPGKVLEIDLVPKKVLEIAQENSVRTLYIYILMNFNLLSIECH